MSKALNINFDTFEKEVINSEIPVLVDFWAPWCMPCQMMGPVLDEVAGEYEGKLKVVKVDIEDPQNQNLAMSFQIQSIPNLKIIKGGEVVGEILGFRPKEMLIHEVEHFIE